MFVVGFDFGVITPHKGDGVEQEIRNFGIHGHQQTLYFGGRVMVIGGVLVVGALSKK